MRRSVSAEPKATLTPVLAKSTRQLFLYSYTAVEEAELAPIEWHATAWGGEVFSKARTASGTR